MIIVDAQWVLELHGQIKALEGRCERLLADSQIARRIDTIPGFALVCSSDLAGEIGTLDRFRNEASLAVYLGMANLDGRRKRPRG